MELNELQVFEMMDKAKNVSQQEVDTIIDKAREMRGLTAFEVACLLYNENQDTNKKILQLAQDIKMKKYGKRVVLFAPLYISDYCQNNCLYCGFKQSNDFKRTKLSVDEIKKEVEILQAMGHKRLALEFGEDLDAVSIDDMIEYIETIYNNFDIRRVNINLAATTLENYKRLAAANVGTYILFQETYHKASYEHYHVSGPKSDYYRQLNALDLAIQAGLEDVGGGVLLGLYDPVFEAISLCLHNEYLLENYEVEFHTLSFPRLKKASNVTLDNFKNLVDDEMFIKLIAVLRMAMPNVGFILSTRESVEMRSFLINHGISQVSAGSKTTVKGYQNDDQTSQFETSNPMSLKATFEQLLEAGYLPSYCCACYRKNRVGKKFHTQIEEDKIAKLCLPNAILTTLEFLLDQSFDLTYIEALKLQIDLIVDENIKQETASNFDRILAGERDLYL